MTRHVHFIGIGGIGVSGLARAFLHSGWRVSGSDSARSEIVRDLERLRGISISIGNRVGNVPASCDLVVHSLAVRPDNPEFKEARQRGIPVKSYPEALGELTKEYITVTVSGSHGKSTTTAMLALILIKAGLDPTVIVGTKLKEFGGSNFRAGKSRYLLIEADEWSRAFLNYFPRLAVITNVDAEHLDTYKTLAGVKRTFAQYVKRLPQDGRLVINQTDANSRHLKRSAKAQTVFFAKPAKPWRLGVPGAHNQMNAEAAWSAARLLGVKRSVAEKALAAYSGAWRRMERLKAISYKLKAAVLYSDYAHHPTEIRATVAAFKEKYPNKKLLVIFQAHQIDRLTRLFRDFAKAFAGADEAWILPTYQVKGREYRGRKKTGADLAAAIPGGVYDVSLNKAMRDISKLRNIGNYCIVFMGAGDIDENVRRLLR